MQGPACPHSPAAFLPGTFRPASAHHRQISAASPDHRGPRSDEVRGGKLPCFPRNCPITKRRWPVLRPELSEMSSASAKESSNDQCNPIQSNVFCLNLLFFMLPFDRSKEQTTKKERNIRLHPRETNQMSSASTKWYSNRIKSNVFYLHFPP